MQQSSFNVTWGVPLQALWVQPAVKQALDWLHTAVAVALYQATYVPLHPSS